MPHPPLDGDTADADADFDADAADVDAAQEHLDYHLIVDKLVEHDIEEQEATKKHVITREMWIREESQKLCERMEKQRNEELIIRKADDDLWRSRLNVVVAQAKRHDWLLSETTGCASLFRSADIPQVEHTLHKYHEIGNRAKLVAEKCEFLLARDEWMRADNLPDEVRKAQLSTVENIWSGVVRNKQALLNANLEDIGWLDDIQAPDMMFQTELKRKKRISTNPMAIKIEIFRRWKLLYKKEISDRMKQSIFGKKKLFLEHCLKIYRLVLLGLMRNAFQKLYHERPAPFSFRISEIIPGASKQMYFNGAELLSRNNDTVLCLNDGAIILNLSKNIIKSPDNVKVKSSNYEMVEVGMT